jgi:hypothetical protein
VDGGSRGGHHGAESLHKANTSEMLSKMDSSLVLLSKKKEKVQTLHYKYSRKDQKQSRD